MTLCDPVYNTVISNGTFVRFLYSAPTYSMSSIYVELPFRGWTAYQYVTSGETGSGSGGTNANVTYKIKCNFDWARTENQEIVKWLSDLETALLEKYEIHRTLSSTTLRPITSWTFPISSPSFGSNGSAYLPSNYSLSELTLGRLQKTREHGVHAQITNGCIRISNKMCGSTVSPNSSIPTHTPAHTPTPTSLSTPVSVSVPVSVTHGDVAPVQIPLEQNKRWDFRASTSTSATDIPSGATAESTMHAPVQIQHRHLHHGVSGGSGYRKEDGCVPLALNETNSAIVLKLTGIWETTSSYGLTFKFQLVEKP